MTRGPAPTSTSRTDIVLDAFRELYESESGSSTFVPGETDILSSGATVDLNDRLALLRQALDFRIAAGAASLTFEQRFARYLGCRKAHLTNSGSSANLLALAALCVPELDGRLRPGDEVITCATSFPTTVNPIIQNGLVPVFVDAELGTYNASLQAIRAATGPRTRAIMMAHSLGNPFEAAELRQYADDSGLWLIEDNCDAVGSTYHGKRTGSFGHLSTVSFYPAHHITMGEAGCVLTDDLRLARIVESLRDWGRDCWCEPGQDNRCFKRFDTQAGELPRGFDHKYVFSHIGYNLKTTDLQAGLGLSQLDRIDDFTARRRHNWNRLRTGLDGLDWLVLPEKTPGSEPSWFGFVITITRGAPFSRADLVSHLQRHSIHTRALFAGNLTRHPGYRDVSMRVPAPLTNSDTITERTFWVGVYPAITDEMVDYMVSVIADFVTRQA